MTEQPTDQQLVEEQPDAERELVPEAGEQVEQPSRQTGDDDYEAKVKSLRAEARGYRQKASAARQEVERLTTLAETYIRRVVEAQAADRLSRPGLLWQVWGVAPMDLLSDEGEVDAERLDAAVTATLEAIPEARPRAHHGDLGAKRSTATRASRSFGDVLKGRGR